jgi:hypothetical protein
MKMETLPRNIKQLLEMDTELEEMGGSVADIWVSRLFKRR